MFAERAIRSDRAPQNDARFGERGRNECGIIGFLCKALVERFVSELQACKAAFIDGAAMARSKNPREV
jgi:hypothetical protein